MENQVAETKTLQAVINTISKEFEIVENSTINDEINNSLNHHKNVILFVVKELTEEIFLKTMLEDDFLKVNQLTSICGMPDTLTKEKTSKLIQKINKETESKAYCFLPTGIGAYSDNQKLYTRIVRQTTIDEKKLIVTYMNKLTKQALKRLNKDLEKVSEEIKNSLIILTGTNKENSLVPLVVINKKELTTQWKIRLARRTEYFEFRKLADQFQKLYRTSRKDLFPMGVTYLQTEFYNLCDGVNDTILLMYEQDDKVLGFIEGALTTTYGVREFNDHRIMTIKRLFVEENNRRQHIATRLYEQLCQYAKKRKCDRIEIEIYHFSEEAIKFITAIGMNILSLQYEKKIEKR